MTVAVVFLRWEGGRLGGEHCWREWREDEPWPPPLHAWFTRSKNEDGYDVWPVPPDGSKPKELHGFIVDRYKRVRSTVRDGEPIEGEVYGALYRYDPEER